MSYTSIPFKPFETIQLTYIKKHNITQSLSFSPSKAVIIDMRKTCITIEIATCFAGFDVAMSHAGVVVSAPRFSHGRVAATCHPQHAWLQPKRPRGEWTWWAPSPGDNQNQPVTNSLLIVTNQHLKILGYFRIPFPDNPILVTTVGFKPPRPL